MLNWLRKRGENSRIYMCCKEVRWDIERATDERLAIILALSCLYRDILTEEMGVPANVLDRPSSYERGNLITFYSVLETVRNNNAAQFGQVRTFFKGMGLPLPEFLSQHTANVGRAIETWMCTIGGGAKPEVQEEVRLIWGGLLRSAPLLPQAMMHLHAVEERTERHLGESPRFLRHFTPEDVAFGADDVPADYRQKQRF
jgi:hypothetical protein